MSGRRLQRIEQGKGRGIRSRNDYAVVLLLGTKLVRRLHHPAEIHYFSPATQVQLTFSREKSPRTKNGTIQDFKDVVDHCLGRAKAG